MPRVIWSVLLALLAATAVTADDDKALTERRHEVMRQEVGKFKFKSLSDDVPEVVVQEPIFRYTDPARGYVDAALWILGDKGRPAAVLSTELHPNFAEKYGPRVVIEFLAVSDETLAMTGPMSWSPNASGVTFQKLAGAEAPQSTREKRQLQARQLAARITGSETVGKQNYELRLLPQPIYRYPLGDDPELQGFVFNFAYGVNPEVLLFLEPAGDHWDFGAGRLAGASSIQLKFDEEVVWLAGPVKYSSNEPYTANNWVVEIPGFDAQGNLIVE